MDLFGTDATLPRRLPVYLLLDTSASMAGDAIEAVNTGVQMLLNALRSDPQALETAYLSIITFGGEARVLQPLSDLALVHPARFQAAGNTPLGGALRLLNVSLDRDVIRNDSQQGRKGDYKPLVFLMTDGEPTDTDWQNQAAQLRQRTDAKLANLIAIGCGSNVKQATLQALSAQPLYMRDMSAQNFRALFQWVSASVKVASVRASQLAPALGGAAASGATNPGAAQPAIPAYTLPSPPSFLTFEL